MREAIAKNRAYHAAVDILRAAQVRVLMETTEDQQEAMTAYCKLARAIANLSAEGRIL